VPKRSPKLPLHATRGGFDFWTPLLAAARGEKVSRFRGVKPEFKITAPDWERIEGAYGQRLTRATRTKVLEATRSFIYWEELERRAEPLEKSKKHIRGYKKTAKNLRADLMAAFDHSDATRYAVLNLDAALNASDGLASLVCELAAFETCCEAVLSNLEIQEATERQWVRWIQHVAQIMNEDRLPTGVRKDAGNKSKSDRQSPFVIFVRELQHCLPRDCIYPKHSGGALAHAISKALKSGLKRPLATRK
jgi:hypothetical protein